MSQPKAGEHEAPHSLAPVQLEGTSEDLRDLEKLRDGSGWRLLFMVALVSVVTVGGVKLLDVMDTREAYVHAAGQLERSDGEPRDAFMRCALPTYQRSQLTTQSGLRLALERTTESMQSGYGRVLTSCTPLLSHFQESVKDLRAPADMRAQVDLVAKATDQLVNAWQDMRTFLVHSGAAYDQAQAARHIEQISVSWQRYQNVLEQAQKSFSSRL
jgi:hypothetical protein